eukprot:gene1692-451_t
MHGGESHLVRQLVEAILTHNGAPHVASVLKESLEILSMHVRQAPRGLTSEAAVIQAIQQRLAAQGTGPSANPAVAAGLSLVSTLQVQQSFTSATRHGLLYLLLSCARLPGADRYQPFVWKRPATLGPRPAIGPLNPSSGGPGGSTEFLPVSRAVLEPASRAPMNGGGSTPMESTLVHDLIFVFQGVDGTSLFYDSLVQEFRMPEEMSARLPSHIVAMVNHLMQVGTRVRSIKAQLSHVPLGGSQIAQSIAHAMQQQMDEYLAMISVFETAIHKNSGVLIDFSRLRCQSFSQALVQHSLMTADSQAHLFSGNPVMSLRKLVAHTRQPFLKLRAMDTLLSKTRKQKGGKLLAQMYPYTQHGGRDMRKWLHLLFNKTAQPIVQMILAWVTDGDLEKGDPYQEFFVGRTNNSKPEDFWTKWYELRPDMLPPFITRQMAHTILSAGKAVRFVQECCHQSGYTIRHKVLSLVPAGDLDVVEMEAQSSLLSRVTDTALRCANASLTDLVLQTHRLKWHLLNIKKYLLLAKGDTVQLLMDNLINTLNGPRIDVHTHHLESVVESTLRTGTDNDAEHQVLKYLHAAVQLPRDVPVQEAVGWDVFALQYIPPTPLDVILTQQMMGSYTLLFQWLWRIKRMEASLAGTYLKHTTLSHYSVMGQRWKSQTGGPSHAKDAIAPAIKSITWQSALLRHQMAHFCNNLQYYLMFEVLEDHWKTLSDALDEAQSLDDIIQCHTQYLQDLVQGFLMTDTNADVKRKLSSIVEIVLRFCEEQDYLYSILSPYFNFDGDVLTDQESADDSHLQNSLSKAAATLEQTQQNYLDLLASLLENIDTTHQQSLSSQIAPSAPACGVDPQGSEFLCTLGLRLDFNEYYQTKLAVNIHGSP